MACPINEETPIVCPKCGKALGMHVLAADRPADRAAKQAAMDSAISFHQTHECGRQA